MGEIHLNTSLNKSSSCYKERTVHSQVINLENCLIFPHEEENLAMPKQFTLKSMPLVFLFPQLNPESDKSVHSDLALCFAACLSVQENRHARAHLQARTHTKLGLV